MGVSKNARVAKTVEKKGVEIFYGTKQDWLIKELPFPEYNLNMYFENASVQPVVVCKDERGYYITGKNFLSAHVLDPYRMYHRFMPENIMKEIEAEATVAES